MSNEQGYLHLKVSKKLSKDYFALLKIKELYQEKLRSITEESAYAEGGYTVDSYIEKFYEINPKLNRELHAFLWLWVVKFDKVGPGNKPIAFFLRKDTKEEKS